MIGDEIAKRGNVAISRAQALPSRNQVSFLPSRTNDEEEARPDYFESLARFEAWRKIQHSTVEQFMITTPESANVVPERDVLDDNDHYSRLLKGPKGIMLLFDNETMDNENVDACLEALLHRMPEGKTEEFRREVRRLEQSNKEEPVNRNPVPLLDFSLSAPALFGRSTSRSRREQNGPPPSALNSNSKVSLNTFKKQSSFKEMQIPFTTCQNTESKCSTDGRPKERSSLLKKKRLSIRLLSSARKGPGPEPSDYTPQRTSSREKKTQKMKVKNVKKQKQYLAAIQQPALPVQSVFYPTQPLDYMQVQTLQPVKSAFSSLRKKQRSIDEDPLASVESDMRRAIGLPTSHMIEP